MKLQYQVGYKKYLIIAKKVNINRGTDMVNMWLVKENMRKNGEMKN